jgi:hypothetical protein
MYNIKDIKWFDNSQHLDQTLKMQWITIKVHDYKITLVATSPPRGLA